MKRKRDAKIWFSQEIRNNMNKMFDLLDESLLIMIQNLESGQKDPNINMGPVYEIEEKINNLRETLKEEHIKNVEANKYKYQAGVIYSDLFNDCEKMGDYVINVSEAIAEIEKPVKAKGYVPK